MMRVSTGTNKGFTLIELMITVVIVAILASVAYPSYTEHVRKARRTDATVSLLELAQFMERYYTSNGRYTADALGNAPALPFTKSPKDGTDRFYALALNNLTATTYTLTAVPQQADRCGTLTLTNTGVKQATGGTVDECWGR